MTDSPIEARSFDGRQPLYFPGEKRLAPFFRIQSSSVEQGQSLPISVSPNLTRVVHSPVRLDFLFLPTSQF
jgi:hypothetical protein